MQIEVLFRQYLQKIEDPVVAPQEGDEIQENGKTFLDQARNKFYYLVQRIIRDDQLSEVRRIILDDTDKNGLTGIETNIFVGGGKRIVNGITSGRESEAVGVNFRISPVVLEYTDERKIKHVVGIIARRQTQ
jgi:hypothetical protein